MASPTWIKPSPRLSFFFPIEIWTEGFSQSWTRFNHCWGNGPNMLKDSHHSGDKKNSITSELLFTAHITLINHTKTPHTRMNEELANHKWPFFLFFLLIYLQVKIAYINFLNHCYVDTEVEMKEIYTSNHMWKLFENFLVDICRVDELQCFSTAFQASIAISYFSSCEISMSFSPPHLCYSSHSTWPHLSLSRSCIYLRSCKSSHEQKPNKNWLEKCLVHFLPC